eukprot:8905780-Alexandrium_andersonii.AAC.1
MSSSGRQPSPRYRMGASLRGGAPEASSQGGGGEGYHDAPSHARRGKQSRVGAGSSRRNGGGCDH